LADADAASGATAAVDVAAPPVVGRLFPSDCASAIASTAVFAAITFAAAVLAAVFLAAAAFVGVAFAGAAFAAAFLAAADTAPAVVNATVLSTTVLVAAVLGAPVLFAAVSATPLLAAGVLAGAVGAAAIFAAAVLAAADGAAAALAGALVSATGTAATALASTFLAVAVLTARMLASPMISVLVPAATVLAAAVLAAPMIAAPVISATVISATVLVALVISIRVLGAAVVAAVLSWIAAAAAASASRTRVWSNADAATRSPCGKLAAWRPNPTRGARPCALPPAAAAAARDGRAPWENGTAAGVGAEGCPWPVGADGWTKPLGAEGWPWTAGSTPAMVMPVMGANGTVRRSCVRCSRRLNLMSVAFAFGSLSTISSMSATLSRAGAERVANILRTDTIVSPFVGPLVLSAARRSTWSTSTVCGHSLPLSVLGHQGRLTRILATEAPLRTLLTIDGTRVLISVSGLVDAVKNAITTCLDDWLGITGSGGVAVSGQVFAEERLRPPVGAAFERISSSSSVAELSVRASSSVRGSSGSALPPSAPFRSGKVDGGGAAPVEGAPVAASVVEDVRLEAVGGSPRGTDVL